MADSGDVRELFTALAFVGDVKAVRTEYQVYRTAIGDYVVLSRSSRGRASYHMTRIAKAAVEGISNALSKGPTTTGALMKDDRTGEVFGEGEGPGLRFDLLMALYVLVAEGRAEMEKSGRNLVFSESKED